MGILEVANCAAILSGMGVLLLLVGLGWWQWLDPSGEAPDWLADAERALDRGDVDGALRCACRAMTLPTWGWYTARQARTTVAALDLATRALQRRGGHLPPPAWNLRHRLARGQRRPGRIVLAAREALDALRRELDR